MPDNPPNARLLVVLPVCQKDETAALRNLEWLCELEQSVDFPCLISVESGFNAQAVYTAAVPYFSQVTVKAYPAFRQGARWPDPQNWAWRQAALSCQRLFPNSPWLWWEQDAVPLRKGWLYSLADEYASCGRPFMGALGSNLTDQFPPHLNGVAIYPPLVSHHVPSSMFYGIRIPFDILGGSKVFAQSHISPLFCHVWSPDGPGGKPTTFQDALSLSQIPNEAVIFHRCKDDSLVLRLREARNCPEEPSQAKKQPSFLCLGRYGDLVNLLPVFDLAAQEAPAMVIHSHEFSSLFTGTSYLIPHSLELSTDKLSEAKEAVEGKFDPLIACQVYGDGKPQSCSTRNYNRDAWKMAGQLGNFNNRTMLPRFDARSPKREEELISQFVKPVKPLVLFAIRGGYSSPFRKYADLEKPLREALESDFQVVDLCEIKCQQIYDLLGLFDRATCLISADSVHLHLAAASQVPVCALLSDRSTWAQTAPRCNVVWKENYTMAATRVAKLLKALRNLPVVPFTPKPPQILHLVEPFWQQHISERRYVLSWQSWQHLYRSGQMLAGYTHFAPKRTSSERRLNYLKDLLASGLDQARDQDVLVWTNGDNILAENLPSHLWAALDKHNMVTSRRIDYASHARHAGRDLCAWRAGWLREHFSEMPDFLLGAPEFDVWMALAARMEIGINSAAHELLVDMPCELPAGSVLHINHGVSAWDGANRKRLATNQYNLRLLREWCQRVGSRVRFLKDGSVNWGK